MVWRLFKSYSTAILVLFIKRKENCSERIIIPVMLKYQKKEIEKIKMQMKQKE